MAVKKKKKVKLSKKRDNILCKYCESAVTITEHETLSVKSEPITEIQVSCTNCNRRYVI